MIPARPSAFLRRFMGKHVEGRFGRVFESVRVQGLGPLARELEAGPRIVVSNHTSFWDPMFGILLANRLLDGCEGYAMMDAGNLRRLPFLGRLGGFGVELGDVRDGARVLRYAAHLLDRPRVLVWVFPQGRERPVDQRPLGFLGGAAVLARLAQVPIVPVGLRYEFGKEQRPTAYASFGPPLPAGKTADEGRRAQERAVEAELGRISATLAAPSPESAFATVLRGRRLWLASWAEWMLARLTRYPG